MMQVFFRPAISLMNRLKYAGKFAVAGGLTFVSIAALLVSLISHLYDEIRQIRQELVVTELILPLQNQLLWLQQQRGISATFLSGDASLLQKLVRVRDAVDAAVKQVDAVEARHSALLQSHAEWSAIKDELASLQIRLLTLKPAETMDVHNQLITRILRFQEAAADAGGLMIDRQSETHHLAETLVRSLPEMLDRLGRMRARGAGVLVRKTLNDEDRIRFAVDSQLLDAALENLRLDLQKAGQYAPSIAPALAMFSKELGETVATARALLDTDIIGARFQVSPQHFFDKFTLAIDIGYRALFDTLLPTLNERLEARIDRLQQQLLTQIGLVAIFLLLLSYVSIGVCLSVIEAVRRLSVGAASIAGGDLTARIHLDGRDELVRVGDAFNEMAVSLDAQLRKSQEIAESLTGALAVARLADQTKDEFLANISHELRTPLNAVIGMAGLAQGLSTDPRQRDYLDKISISGKHLNRIINDLLDLSKIAAGHMQFETIDFSLRALVQQSTSAMAHRATEKGIALLDNVDPAVPDVLLGDPLRIEQILLNLLGNAIKFTSAGRVEIRVSLQAREAGRVCLDFEVEDTGIGILPEELQHLFKPFSQADATISRKFGGTGLGLTISKRLAEMMGGGISVTSRASAGTTFRVRLWFAQGEAVRLPGMAASSDLLPLNYENARVLVADDQPLNREIVEALLGAVGITPQMTENGQEALDVLRAAGVEAFDLVLMDVQMPVMDGLAATRELRRWPGFELLPIIAMTAHTMAHEKEIASEAGVNDHIGKPFDNASFYHTLARWIPGDKHQAVRAAALVPAASDTAKAPDRAQRIDFAAGLARFSGKEARYRHWLADFKATAADVPEQIRSQVAGGELEKAGKTAHAFKGRVGMLGMTDLHAEVAALEGLLRSSSPVNEPLASLSRSIAQVIDGLTAYLATGETGAAV